MPDPSLIFTAPIVRGSGATRKENCSVELLGLAIYGDYRHGFRLPCIDPETRAMVIDKVTRDMSEPYRAKGRY